MISVTCGVERNVGARLSQCVQTLRMDFVDAEVTFLTSEEGGRRSPPLDSVNYRPHVVVGDPNQRRAIADENRVIQEHYLGVLFAGDDDRSLDLGARHEVRLQLWNPQADYSALKAGAAFTIREGGKIVGFGRVLSVAVSGTA